LLHRNIDAVLRGRDPWTIRRFHMNVAYDTAAARNPVKLAGPSMLSRALRGLWVALESVGRARARREMLRLSHELHASRPELAMHLRRVARQSWL
jgi:hypothetical protein